MKQSSEKFAEKMLENESNGEPVSFADQIAKVEQTMNNKINEMTDKILASVAESQKVQTTEPIEVQEIEETIEDEVVESEDE